MKRIFTLLLLLLSAMQAFAGKPAPYGFWPGYFGSAAITDKWGIWAEAQQRMYDFAGDGEQLLLRTAITYNLGKDKSQQVAQGYAYVRSRPYVAGTELKRLTEEHRLYQQLILRQRKGRLYLTHRYRAEERFLQDDFRLRFRYNLGANLCINDTELKKGTLYLSAYNEVFLHAARPAFDRNRLYGGIGYGVSKTLRVEAGHMWQMQEAATRPQLQLQVLHTLKR